ncbi:hypothetical protein V5799_008533 [Amblyomma americanum]|uniref:BEN domain-containing protein n=1 Tax=Amblyomma americanum TaxID=6943 RepID=A0AAQ4FEF2_AMBAM
MAKKRLAMPKIPDYEESSSEEEEETAAQKKKKQKRLMLASKKAEYETILKKNMDNARTKTLAAQSRDTRQAAKKRARASSESASESEDSLCAKTSHPAEDTEVAHLPREDFTYLDDGSFHLSKGIIITAAGAAKILQNKKGTLVCKDAAHAIWGPDTLAVRSVRGVVASTKKALGEEPKQPLTPEKIGVIVATVKHWGLQRGVDVDPVVKNINRILSEKIQDIVKSKRKE